MLKYTLKRCYVNFDRLSGTRILFNNWQRTDRMPHVRDGKSHADVMQFSTTKHCLVKQKTDNIEARIEFLMFDAQN